MKKQCPKCQEIKEFSEFYKRSDRKDGRETQCKKCQRPRRREYQKEYKRKIRLEALAALGGECKWCGYKDWRALQIDHIDGGGKLERGKEYHTLTEIIKDPEKSMRKYQLLCSNCNWIKRYEENEVGGRGNKWLENPPSENSI